MFILNKDLINLLEVIDEFYEDKNNKNLKYFKSLLDKIEICEIEENNESLDEFIKKFEDYILEISSKSLGGDGKNYRNNFEVLRKLPKEKKYYNYILAGMQLKKEFQNGSIEAFGAEDTAKNYFTSLNIEIKDKLEDMETVLGYKRIAGINLFGYIAKYKNEILYQCILYKDGEFYLFVPKNGNLRYSKPRSKYDVNSDFIKEDVIREFYGEDVYTNIDYDSFIEKLDSLKNKNEFIDVSISRFKEIYRR